MKPYSLLFILLLASPFVLSQNRFDIVITEIMVDPSPPVGLPNNEWIELKNISTSPVNLQNWRIADASGQSGPMPSYILQPDSFIIICAAGSLAAMSAFGPAVAVSGFTSLDNDGDILSLKSPGAVTIHAIQYTSAWYQNELKREGGWTLEMIDPRNPCAGISNWKASVNPVGGSPGKENSVNGINSDNVVPQLKRTYTIDAYNIVAVFDEPLDSIIAVDATNYHINGITIISAKPIPPLFNTVLLTLNQPLQAETVYELVAGNLKDCAGNIISQNNKAGAGLPGELSFSEVVINEILFNPRSNAEDYIELYNRSHKIFDVSKISIAGRNSSGVISNIRQLSAIPWLIFPGDYIVASADEVSLAREYTVKNPDGVFVLSSLPSMPDDKGTVILLNQQGNITDEVNYHKDWHFKLLTNDEGVALERIDPDGPTQNASNWHSAASTAGYGTPTYQNSQYKLPVSIASVIEVQPKIFSPDNDGRDDIVTVQYKINEPGFVASVRVFDAAGRLVRTLVRNDMLGREGYWNWDGLGEKGNKLPVGLYIIFTQVFNLQGKISNYKHPVVLARQLN